MTLVGWFVDFILLVLLFVAIWVGGRINRRLAEVREAQNELADLVAQLDRATEKAHQSVGELREAGGQAREILSGEMGRARALADELSLIVEAGDNLAGRLESKLTYVSQLARDGSEEDVPAKRPSKVGQENILEAIKNAR